MKDEIIKSECNTIERMSEKLTFTIEIRSFYIVYLTVHIIPTTFPLLGKTVSVLVANFFRMKAFLKHGRVPYLHMAITFKIFARINKTPVTLLHNIPIKGTYVMTCLKAI